MPGQAVMDATRHDRAHLSDRQRTSWVILLTDLNSRIPVTIAPGNIQAIMAGDNSRMPSLDMVSHTVILMRATRWSVPAMAGLLPPGLPIGTVVSDGRAAFASRFWPTPPPARMSRS